MNELLRAIWNSILREKWKMGNNNFYIAHNHSRQYCETAWEGSEWRALKKSHHHFLCSPRKKSVEERSFVWFPCPILHRISHDNNSGAVLGFAYGGMYRIWISIASYSLLKKKREEKIGFIYVNSYVKRWVAGEGWSCCGNMSSLVLIPPQHITTMNNYA